jgi:ferric-dicitrate binding protein FerR (iron transport regulator)
MHLREDRMSRTHSKAVISEAVRWFSRFRMKGPTALSPDESAEWARWAADKEHLAAFQRTEQLWEDLGQVKKDAQPSQRALATDDYDPQQSVSHWLIRNKRKKPPR